MPNKSRLVASAIAALANINFRRTQQQVLLHTADTALLPWTVSETCNISQPKSCRPSSRRMNDCVPTAVHPLASPFLYNKAKGPTPGSFPSNVNPCWRSKKKCFILSQRRCYGRSDPVRALRLHLGTTLSRSIARGLKIYPHTVQDIEYATLEVTLSIN